jgi:hypothetical protein
MCKRHQYVTIAVLLIFAIVERGISTAWGLDSCELERPSEVVRFEKGSFPSGSFQTSGGSDPSILLRSSSDLESLRLGIGGSITLQFTVPIANYPAAGALTIERPTGAAPCSSYPVRAEVSGSIDGVNFISLGSTCETAAFDLGAFPWIAYLRIKDVTDASDPRFGATPVLGFDLRAVSGPGCLKYSHCAVAPIADSAASDRLNAYALSLSHLGNDFVFEKPASFEEYGNGSARLSGTAHQVGDPSTVFDVTMSFSGKVQSPPPQSPVLELKPSAYTARGGPVDPSSWYYYKQARGTLIGKGAQSGTRISLDATLRPLQVGEGANGRNASLGASGSLTYSTSSSPSTAEITIDLTSCSTTPPFPTPDPTPTPGIYAPTCQKEDISDTLVALDSNLRGRVTIINRATRLLLQNRRSGSNVRFTTEARAKAHNLYSRAWSDVWKQDRTILTCAPSTLCFDVHLEPSQAALAASAEALDTTVKRALKIIEKRVSSRKAKQEIRNFHRKHTIQRQRFIEKLATLPGHSMRCR